MHGYRPQTGGLEAHRAGPLPLPDLAWAYVAIFAAELAGAALLSGSALTKIQKLPQENEIKRFIFGQ
jgi:hypothetical protein